MILSLVSVLLAIAFFTLIERKRIGLAHYRKGPNKITIRGVSQPLSDALKLITKELTKISFVKQSIITLGPIVSITLILIS